MEKPYRILETRRCQSLVLSIEAVLSVGWLNDVLSQCVQYRATSCSPLPHNCSGQYCTIDDSKPCFSPRLSGHLF